MDELVLHSHLSTILEPIGHMENNCKVGRGKGCCVACNNFCKKTPVTLQPFYQTIFVL